MMALLGVSIKVRYTVKKIGFMDKEKAAVMNKCHCLFW